MTATKSSHVRWFLIFWLFVLSAVSFLDRVNISIASNSIVEAYKFTNGQLGYIFSSLLAGYALFQTVGGRLADRFGSRRVLALGVLWWGIFTALTAAVPATIEYSLFLFISIRFLLGAGEAVVYPAANQFVARWIPIRERGVANGLIFAGVGVPAFAPHHYLFHASHGWRASFGLVRSSGAQQSGLVSLHDTPRTPAVARSELRRYRRTVSSAVLSSRSATSSLIRGREL
jgi:ACS family glucarate transporter-like MFS transporter